ncbi:hypothetical protein ES288_D10G120900v1 [Gossypium darwinii]|uniref:Uncharacterized protein n=1 Tax=Gossypium darwinii TaxID=34276 RepID=A0A5D2AYR0_GOSDA|nr:hypothetical protein ES288_D10G120900v1 [Gossypium darwinii]
MVVRCKIQEEMIILTSRNEQGNNTFPLKITTTKKVVAEETKVQKLFFFCASTTDFSITSTFSFKS